MLVQILLVHMAAMASPGPNVALVARTAMAESRQAGVWACIGVATAAGLWAGAAALGLAVALAGTPGAATGLRILGGLYLVYLGARMLRAAAAHHPVPAAAFAPAGGAAAPISPPRGVRRSAWMRGTLTNLSNPKAAVYYVSIFATLIPPGASPAFRLAAVGVIVASGTAWHVLLAVALSTRGAQGAYLRARRGIDAAAGLVLAGFGVAFVLGLG